MGRRANRSRAAHVGLTGAVQLEPFWEAATCTEMVSWVPVCGKEVVGWGDVGSASLDVRLRLDGHGTVAEPEPGEREHSQYFPTRHGLPIAGRV